MWNRLERVTNGVAHTTLLHCLYNEYHCSYSVNHKKALTKPLNEVSDY